MRLKNSETKRTKSCFTIVSETYKDFAENTSLQGLKYTVKHEIQTWEKVFWIIVVICGLCCATYMTVLFWERYISNPTRTTILTSYAPVTTITFPAVTICNINRIMVSKVEKFMKNLTLDGTDEETIRSALPQLLAFNYPNNIYYNMTELKILQDVLAKNDLNDISFVMSEISQSCDEMLLSCSWEKKKVDCAEIFTKSLTADGYCCSFNYGNSRSPSGIFTMYNGLLSGLVIVLNPMIQPVQYSSLYSSGIKVFIHDPTEYPGSQSTIKLISVGRVAYLQILGTKIICSEDVKNLPVSHRHCLFPNEYKLKSFYEYSSSNCLSECVALRFYAYCKCVPFQLAFVDAPICNISSIPCLNDVRSNDPKFGGINICDCPSQCEDDFYTVLSTSTLFEYNLSKTLLSFNSSQIDDYTVLLNVFFLNQRQTVYLRDTITSTIYLLSSFGGVYSLFMGCSLITIFEIFYYCIFRFVVNMKLIGKVDSDFEKTILNKSQKIQRIHFESRDSYHNNIFL